MDIWEYISEVTIRSPVILLKGRAALSGKVVSLDPTLYVTVS